MQFVYGGYSHADNSVAFKNIQKTYVMGPNGRLHMLRVQWSLEGKLLGLNQGDIMTQLAELMSIYSFPNQSAGFPGTPFYLQNGDAIGGVLVTGPITHGEIKGAEGVTYLRYGFSLQADFPWAINGQVLAFSETTSFTDNFGLPVTVERLPQNAPPILQTISAGSWYYGTQSGSNTVAFVPADYEPPMFPQYLRTSSGRAREVTFQSPEMCRGVPTKFTTKWKYDFISAVPFFSYPNVVG